MCYYLNVQFQGQGVIIVKYVYIVMLQFFLGMPCQILQASENTSYRDGVHKGWNKNKAGNVRLT